MGTAGYVIWELISEPPTVVSLTSNLGKTGKEGPAKCMFSNVNRIFSSLPSRPFFMPTMGFRALSTHLRRYSVVIKSSTKILFEKLRWGTSWGQNISVISHFREARQSGIEDHLLGR